MRIVLFLVSITVLLSTCSNEEPTSEATDLSESSTTYKELRAKVIDEITSQNLARFELFESNLVALEEALFILDMDFNAEGLNKARQSFEDVMLSWQTIEATLYVPDDSNEAWTISRDDIYSWPLTSRCRIDQELVKKTYENTQDLQTLLVNATGLDAVEYLLWHSDENECPPQAMVNADGSWREISDLNERRAKYLLASVKLVKSNTDTLKKSSLMLGESLKKTNTAEALNVLSNSLYYLDTNVKDLKIAQPLGEQECAEDTCFEKMELQFSGLSLLSIHRNLSAFEQTFFADPGFDDLLKASDAADIADDIRAALDEALLISTQNVTLRELHDTGDGLRLLALIKSITDRLKTDFIGVLDLELPQRAEGDND